MSNQAIYGIVSSRKNAEQLIQRLVEAGVRSQDISILSSQSPEFKEFANTHPSVGGTRNWRSEDRLADYTTDAKGELYSSNRAQGRIGTEKHSKAPEGATAGGVTGGIIGGTLGLLAGIGALAIPGMGPFIAAGPLLGALSGLGAGGALGGIIGGLIGAGIPEYEAKRYENRLKEGGVLLSVLTDNELLANRVRDLLQREGAEDVTISSESAAARTFVKK